MAIIVCTLGPTFVVMTNDDDDNDNDHDEDEADDDDDDGGADGKNVVSKDSSDAGHPLECFTSHFVDNRMRVAPTLGKQ